MPKSQIENSAPVPTTFPPTAFMITRAREITEAKSKLDLSTVSIIPSFIDRNSKLTNTYKEILNLLMIDDIDLRRKDYQTRLIANSLPTNPFNFSKDLNSCIKLISSFQKAFYQERLPVSPQDKSASDPDRPYNNSFVEHRKYLSRKPSSENTCDNTEMELLDVLSKPDFVPEDYLKFIEEKIKKSEEPSQQGIESSDPYGYSSGEQQQLAALTSVLSEEMEDSRPSSPSNFYEEIAYYLESVRDLKFEKSIDTFVIQGCTQIKEKILDFYDTNFIKESLIEGGVDSQLAEKFVTRAQDSVDDLFKHPEKAHIDKLFVILYKLLALQEVNDPPEPTKKRSSLELD